ncbi:MAG: hypothetical protein PF495_01825 [Spirochaetales bacterium]|jgi:Tfp pilus assembly protein PilF|nr:hypothetical protein [Spirochaetales bacterium]
MKKSIVAVLLLVLLSACVLTKDPVPSPGPKGVQAQAIEAYGRGVQYMGQSRYLLAREQFSEAASMAVTQGLSDDAVAGMARADTVLQKRRTYHE